MFLGTSVCCVIVCLCNVFVILCVQQFGGVHTNYQKCLAVLPESADIYIVEACYPSCGELCWV